MPPRNDELYVGIEGVVKQGSYSIQENFRYWLARERWDGCWVCRRRRNRTCNHEGILSFHGRCLIINSISAGKLRPAFKSVGNVIDVRGTCLPSPIRGLDICKYLESESDPTLLYLVRK